MVDIADVIKKHNTANEEVVQEKLEESIPVKQEISQSSNSDIIDMTMLSEWFKDKHNNFKNARCVRMSVKGVDPNETLIFTVPHPTNVELYDGSLPRQLRFWPEAKHTPVLNIPGISMDVYNNGFYIISQYSDEIVIKSYGVKTSLEIAICKKIGDYFIPYDTKKFKKKDVFLKIENVPDNQIFIDQFNSAIDKEALIIQYKQIQKYLDKLTSKEDVLKWFILKQNEIVDVNHLKLIDKILIWLFS